MADEPPQQPQERRQPRTRKPRRVRRGSTLGQGAAAALTLEERGQYLVKTVVDRWIGETRHRQTLDKRTTRENRTVFLLAMAGILCMMWHENELQELVISGRYYGEDAYSTMDIAIPALTALLIWRLCCLYSLYAEAKRVAWRFSDRWEAFSCTTLRYKFACEVGAALFMPIPTWVYHAAGVGGVPGWLRHIGLVMFIRVYTAARVLRDSSLVYKFRFQAAQHRGAKKVRVGSLFAMKSALEEKPVFWVVTATVLTVGFFSYCVLITERTERLNGEETAINGAVDAIWFVCVTLTSTGYGDLIPSTYVGLSLAMAEQIVGLCLTSLFVAVVLDQVSMSPREAEMVGWAHGLTMRQELRHRAAALIQHWWFTLRYFDRPGQAGSEGNEGAESGAKPLPGEPGWSVEAERQQSLAAKFKRSGFSTISGFRAQHELMDRHTKDDVTREMLLVEQVENEVDAMRHVVTDKLFLVQRQEAFLLKAIDRALAPDKEQVAARKQLKRMVAQPTKRGWNNVRRQFRPRSLI